MCKNLKNLIQDILMSRGHGWVQRAVEATLKQHPHQHVRSLARFVYRTGMEEPSASQIVSIQSSVRRLAKEGAIVPSPLGNWPDGRKQCWMIPDVYEGTRPKQTSEPSKPRLAASRG